MTMGKGGEGQTRLRFLWRMWITAWPEDPGVRSEEGRPQHPVAPPQDVPRPFHGHSSPSTQESADLRAGAALDLLPGHRLPVGRREEEEGAGDPPEEGGDLGVILVRQGAKGRESLRRAALPCLRASPLLSSPLLSRRHSSIRRFIATAAIQGLSLPTGTPFRTDRSALTATSVAISSACAASFHAASMAPTRAGNPVRYQARSGSWTPFSCAPRAAKSPAASGGIQGRLPKERTVVPHPATASVPQRRLDTV